MSEVQTQAILASVEPTQPAPAETPAAIETAPAEVKPSGASHFSALAKKEKAIRAKQAEVAAKEQAMADREAKIKEMESKFSQFEQVKSTAKQNPLKLLQEAGLSYDEIVQAQLQEITEDPAIAGVKVKLAELERKEEERQAKALEAEKQRLVDEENKIYDGFRARIKSEVGSKGEQYELINAYGQHELVFTTIKDALELKGKSLSIDEAAGLVESYLEKQIESELQRVQSLKKLQGKLAPTPSESKPAPTAPQTQSNEGIGKTGYKPLSKTLNNGMTGSSSVKSKAISVEEARQRAIAKMQGI